MTLSRHITQAGKQLFNSQTVDLIKNPTLTREEKARVRGRLYSVFNNSSERAWRSQLKIYGITEEVFNALFEEQNGLCAICKQPELYRKLSVDHDHLTSKVRGLLCSRCNTGLGLFKDSKVFLEAAIIYLCRKTTLMNS